MSILINIEMPTSCILCDLSHEDGWCPVKQDYIDRYSYETCPLVPIPPHGRLGDLDKLENGLRHMAKYQHGERQQGILGCCETIRLAPTIIQADDPKEE